MNEADRIQRERDRKDAITREANQRAATQSAAGQEAQQLSDIRNETRLVLQLLADKDYPDMVGVTLTKPRFGMKYGSLGYRNESVGAWPIGTYSAEMHGDRYTDTIYLLSDGNFNLAGGRSGMASRGLDDIFLQKYLHNVLNGLRELRLKLERS